MCVNESGCSGDCPSEASPPPAGERKRERRTGRASTSPAGEDQGAFPFDSSINTVPPPAGQLTQSRKRRVAANTPAGVSSDKIRNLGGRQLELFDLPREQAA
jgi:hypothetical protein